MSRARELVSSTRGTAVRLCGIGSLITSVQQLSAVDFFFKKRKPVAVGIALWGPTGNQEAPLVFGPRGVPHCPSLATHCGIWVTFLERTETKT